MTSEQSAHADLWLTLGALVFIAVATLWPFEFISERASLSDYTTRFGLFPRTAFDFPRNIALFIPLGWGVALWLAGRGVTETSRYLLTLLLVGLAVTLCVESLQLFLPGRTPNVSDMTGNVLGTVLGAPCLSAWRRWRVAVGCDRATPTIRSLTPAATYVLLVLVGVWALMWGMSPQGWDPSYRLSLGKAAGPLKPWQGVVSDLVVLDRAVDRGAAERLLQSLIPSDFEEAVALRLPTLDDPDAKHVNWGALADRVNVRRKFTIAFTVATADVAQSELAPLLALANDAGQENLSIEQDEGQLALRWRSPITRVNGLSPAMRFPNVFDSIQSQRVVISFDALTAALYTTEGTADASIQLGPEVAFSALLRQADYWPVSPNRLAYWAYALPLPAVMFAPLPFLLTPYLLARRRSSERTGLLLVLVVLPALLVEGLVAVYEDTPIRMEMAGRGVATMLLGFAVLEAWLRARTGSLKKATAATMAAEQ